MNTETTILSERLNKIQALMLESGSHADFERGMCVMEAVSYVAGEPWSDEPQCASPVIGAFMRSWNDSLDTEDRNRLLKPLVSLLVGSKASPEIEARRSYLALDWMIRVFTPKWLDLVPALHEHAVALRGLEEIMDMAGATAAGKRVTAARDAARAVVWTAAGDAAGDAAWDAAGAAARAVVWTAAWAAAGDALKPTTEWLQDSALDLVHRMLDLHDEPAAA